MIVKEGLFSKKVFININEIQSITVTYTAEPNIKMIKVACVDKAQHKINANLEDLNGFLKRPLTINDKVNVNEGSFENIITRMIETWLPQPITIALFAVAVYQIFGLIFK